MKVQGNLHGSGELELHEMLPQIWHENHDYKSRDIFTWLTRRAD
jgi:hypothetical protein